MILASAFLNQVNSGILEVKPIYLLYGEEPLFLRDSLDGLKKQLNAQGYMTNESYDVDANFDWQSLQMDTQAGSLFSESRMILINMPKGSPGRDGGKFFQDWCAYVQALPPEIVLVVLCERLDNRQIKSKWVTSIESAGLVVQAKPVPSNALPGWCQKQAQKQGLTLEAEAANLLADRVEGNLLAADQEITKLSLSLPAGSVITAQDVLEHVVDQAHYQLFALATAMLNGNTAYSVQMLSRLQQEGIEAPVVLWLLSKELRQLIELAQLTQQISLNQAFQKCRIWQSRQGEYNKAMQRHDLQQWQSLLKQALQIDMMIKGIKPTLNDREIWFGLSDLVAKIAR
ncbi:DNA polymerase III subunit delta [Thiomicrorhabdus sp. Milos-T2]|uniref:DNA polymerase III subunit delta n=1 Tax=Thiomicrorhabdus sp. Milos-T2 TaxID=90814 RepID=UPI0004946741|nr:DNA polymerase III subunit delta [Thiomicrorhabdus sp. Milos-T2]